MRLTQRLLLGSFVIILVFATLVVTIIDGRLRTRLTDQTAEQLEREARLIGSTWHGGVGADSLADAAGRVLGHRVTLVDPVGTVAGDSEFDLPALARLENHADRPEVIAAVARGAGRAIRSSVSAGDEELYVATRAVQGVARVSVSTRRLEEAFDRAERDVLTAALLTIIVALVVAALFSRAIARPVIALRDTAQAIASGDLSQRPALAAPGEVGDLASALHQLAEQLRTRVAALEADETLLRALTDSLNEGVIAVSAQQQVVRINETARRLMNVRAAVPFPIDQLPRERVLHEAIGAALAGEATEAIETALGDRTIELTARPLMEGAAIVAVRDLTPTRRLEMVRRDFVANVSHELRTPLTVLRGFAETLGDEEIPAPQRGQFIDAIVANAQRMQRLVDDLLDLSRMESGGWRPKPVRCDVAQAAEEALAAARWRAAAKGIALDTDIAPEAARVTADPTALRQVLANLVDNAVRHTERGSVTVFARREPDAVAVGVRDTGVGIGPEHLPRIFERFYRADAGRAREEGGTGLGLAIVRHLVEAHGGSVHAESEPGRGTTIGATFPLAGDLPAV